MASRAAPRKSCFFYFTIMNIIRIEKVGNYVVMCNYHLRDYNLSLKAKGLLSYLLSLDNNWELTIIGLSKTLKEGRESISTTMNELIDAGYIERILLHDEKNGKLLGYDYTVYETPLKSKFNPLPGNTSTGNPAEININKKEISNDNSRVESKNFVFNDTVNSIYDYALKYFPEKLQPTGKSVFDWHKTILDLIEIDKKEPREICQVIRWARSDDFWSNNFLSLLKLRKNDRDKVKYYDKFAYRMGQHGKTSVEQRRELFTEEKEYLSSAEQVEIVLKAEQITGRAPNTIKYKEALLIVQNHEKGNN